MLVHVCQPEGGKLKPRFTQGILFVRWQVLKSELFDWFVTNLHDFQRNDGEECGTLHL